MVAEFPDEPPMDRILAMGLRVEKVEGRRVTLKVTGEIGPILLLLAEHDVRHLSFPEPSLEDAFNSYYEAPRPPPGSLGEEDV
jgi:hypothetical protein